MTISTGAVVEFVKFSGVRVTSEETTTHNTMDFDFSEYTILKIQMTASVCGSKSSFSKLTIQKYVYVCNRKLCFVCRWLLPESESLDSATRLRYDDRGDH